MYGYGEFRTKDGRLGLRGKPQRVRGYYHRFYNQVSIIWLDEDRKEIGRETFPEGQFVKNFKPVPTGYRRIYDAGSQRFV